MNYSPPGSRECVSVPTRSKRIRIGQIGTTHGHASPKMETLRKLSSLYEVVGIVEPDPERRNLCADDPVYQGIPWMTEEELLNTPGLQVVAVEQELPDQIQTGLRCLQAGMHIHLDKPGIYTSLQECRDLHAEADRRNLIVQVGYMWRYNPAVVVLFDIIQKGWLGEIHEINGISAKMASPDLRQYLLEYPGGGMHEMGCMLIDILVGIMGKPDSVTAFNRISRDDELADNQLAVFEYPQAVATIRCNHMDPLGFPRREFTVVGEEGTASIRPIEPAALQLGLAQARHGYSEEFQYVELPQLSGRFDGDFLDLEQVIRGEKPLTWDSEHDLVVYESIFRACGLEVDE